MSNVDERVGSQVLKPRSGNFKRIGESLNTRSSRRALIGRLGTLGLVASGGAMVWPRRVAADYIAPPEIENADLTITRVQGTGVATVKMTGTIEFSKYNVSQMQDGLQFAVSCEVREADDDGAYDLCFVYQLGNNWGQDGGDLDCYYFPQSQTNSETIKDLEFTADVPTGWLNQDDNNITRNFEDEVFGIMLVWARGGDNSNWKQIASFQSTVVPGRY